MEARQLWGRYVAASVVPLVLLCLWRLPLAEGMRPAIRFGMPFDEMVQAWLPEGILLGMAAFFAHRAFEPTQTVLGNSSALFAYLVLWLPIWGLASLGSGWIVLGPLAAALEPLLESFVVSGAGGIILAPLMLIASAYYLSGALAVMGLAAVFTAFALPHFLALARSGSLRDERPRTSFGGRLVSVLVPGAIFWLWRALAPVIFLDGTVRGIADAFVAISLIGLFAWLAARVPVGSSASPLDRRPV